MDNQESQSFKGFQIQDLTDCTVLKDILKRKLRNKKRNEKRLKAKKLKKMEEKKDNTIQEK